MQMIKNKLFLSVLLCLNILLFNVSAYDEAFIKKFVSEMSLTEKASQVLMINLDGSKVFPASMYGELQNIVPGAVILFKYNLTDSPKKIREFTDSCKETFSKIGGKKSKEIPPFFALDNEGGKVFRTKGITSFLPAAAEIPKMFTIEEAENIFLLTAAQMKMLGIDFNLAPVAEIYNAENADVLGSRTFSDNADTTVLYASSFVRSMNNKGVLCALKHFPGNSSTDPHNGKAEIKTDIVSLRKNYIFPFKEILKDKNMNTAVLVSHAVVSCIDNVPFCLSKKGITELLRKEIGFEGIILTDDLAMKALKQDKRNSADNAVQALSAGCDMIMTSERNIRTIVNKIADKAATDKKFAARLDEAVITILVFKEKMKIFGQKIETPAPFDIKVFNEIKEKASIKMF